MASALHYALILGVTTLAVGGLSWLFRRLRPEREQGDEGSIRPELWSAWITMIFGTLMCVIAVAAYFTANGGPGAAFAALIGAAVAGFMAPSVTRVHTVRWTGNGVEGPSKMFGPTLGVARTRVAWAEIIKTGKTFTGYWYIEAADRRRVYWSYLYKGHGALTSALRKRCPALELPPDMG